MALSKEQKRDYWSALLTGRKARTPEAASLVADRARAILERRKRFVFSFLLSCAYLAVGLWVWIAKGRVTFFLVLGALAVAEVGYLVAITIRAARVNSEERSH
jgi:hypothetical protein